MDIKKALEEGRYVATLLEEGMAHGYKWSIHHNLLGFRCGYILMKSINFIS